MKYIFRNFIKDIDLGELDFVNQDAILGRDENDDYEEYEVITKMNPDNRGYYDESISMNIDDAIGHLTDLKEAGSNYVQIIYHSDHLGYEFYGLEMRVATPEEIVEHEAKEVALTEKQKKDKIKKLKKELEQLEK